MDVFKFEQHILKKNSIDLMLLIQHYDDFGKFDARHMQAFIEVQSFILNFLTYTNFIEIEWANFSGKKYQKNQSHLKILQIIESEKQKFNLNINAEAACAQFLILIMLGIMNNKLLVLESDDLKDNWYGVHEITQNFIETLEKFFIFFGGGCANNAVDFKKSNRELVILIISTGILNNFFKKKTEAVSEKKRCVFYKLCIKKQFPYN